MWLQQQIGKAKAKWDTRRRGRPDAAELGETAAPQPLELTGRDEGDRPGPSLQRRNVGQGGQIQMQAKSHDEQAAGTQVTRNVDQTDTRSHSIKISTGFYLIIAFFGTACFHPHPPH